MGEDLQIIHLTKSKLREAIEEHTFWKTNLSPIPLNKAKWLLKNPRIEENDYCGLLGMEKDELVAFVYMIPDLIRISSTATTKAYWELLWWVNEKYKNSILGTYIYNEAINSVDQKVIIKSYAENVNEFYKKQPFDVISSRQRYTIFLSVDDSMLIGKFRFLEAGRFIIKRISNLSAGSIRFLNNKKIRKKINQLSFDYLKKLDNETWEFIDQNSKFDAVVKSRDYVNWQLSESQYTQAKNKVKSLVPGKSPNIKISTIKINQNGEVIGFISYLINFAEFNVKYFLVKEEKHYDTCVAALMYHVCKEKKNFIFTDDQKLAEYIISDYKTVFVYKKEKKGLAHKSLNFNSEQITLTNHDGHFY